MFLLAVRDLLWLVVDSHFSVRNRGESQAMVRGVMCEEVVEHYPKVE